MTDMPMMWHPMPGQTWTGVATSFVAMWSVMMVAMMLPSFVLRFRQVAGQAGDGQLGYRAAVVAVAYVGVWSALGVAIFPVGAALSALTASQPTLLRLMPVATGLVVVVAGALQFTAWKARQLACWRDVVNHSALRSADAHAALRVGLRIGMHCLNCCAGLTAVLLVVGLSDVALMIVVTLAGTFERLADNAQRAARAVGLVTLAIGAYMLIR